MGVENIHCKNCTRFKVNIINTTKDIKDLRLKEGYRTKIVEAKTYTCEAYSTELKADQYYGYCPVGQLSEPPVLADKQ